MHILMNVKHLKTSLNRTLIDRARVECQNHWFVYNEKMSVESCAQAVSTLAIQFGDSADGGSAMSRPFGVAILFAGVENNDPQLWHMDPSGTYIRYDAKAIGSGSEGAQQNLQVLHDSRFHSVLFTKFAKIKCVCFFSFHFVHAGSLHR